MSRPKVPGLNDDWAHAQLLIPSAPCPSCTLVEGKPGQPWDCDPDRPGCPLHDVPEQTRDRCCPPGYLHRDPCPMAGLQIGGPS